jgi:hypothetical protein
VRAALELLWNTGFVHGSCGPNMALAQSATKSFPGWLPLGIDLEHAPGSY